MEVIGSMVISLGTDSVQRKAEFKNWLPQSRGKSLQGVESGHIVL